MLINEFLLYGRFNTERFLKFFLMDKNMKEGNIMVVKK